MVFFWLTLFHKETFLSALLSLIDKYLSGPHDRAELRMNNMRYGLLMEEQFSFILYVNFN